MLTHVTHRLSSGDNDATHCTRAGVVMDTDSEETAAPALSLFDSFSVPVVTTSQINQVRERGVFYIVFAAAQLGAYACRERRGGGSGGEDVRLRTVQSGLSGEAWHADHRIVQWDDDALDSRTLTSCGIRHT